MLFVRCRNCQISHCKFYIKFLFFCKWGTSCLIFGMIRAICCVPVSPLRAEPSHRTEMVSQLIFGECCEILEQTKEHWSRIRIRYDGYEGWCTSSHLAEIDEKEFGITAAALTPDWVTALEYNGHPMMVPMGSHLTAMKNGRARWRKNQVHYKGKTWDPAEAGTDPK